MKIAVNWVNDFLEKDLTPAAMAEAMELAGIEVEAIELAAKLDAKIVVGKVLSVKPHPNADKLRLAEVDVKSGKLAIVCGAPNLAAGQLVAVAQVGSTLPDGLTIAAVKMRGETSEGMLCSERELGLGQNHDGIMVLAEGEVGQSVAKYLQTSDVIDTTTSANRWDLNSIIGVAREVAAHTSQKLKRDYPEQLSSSESPITISLEDDQLAGRYQVVKLSVEAARPSPDWLRRRLQAAGLRPISVVVDITNYIMLEYGQPLHAFDAAKVRGNLCVRLAASGEKLTTLDGVERSLNAADAVIADDSGPVALAGVMGGASTEVSIGTTEIILEAASFDPARTRRSAIRHGLRTDGSARFERGVPVTLAPLALGNQRKGQGAIGLLVELAAAKVVAGPSEILTATPVATAIETSVKDIASLLGVELSARQAVDQLRKLSFEAEVTAAGKLRVIAPWWRPDVTQMADVAEETIKLVGFDRLPATLPAWRPTEVSFDQTWSHIWQARAALRSLGLFEVTTYSFIAGRQIDALGLNREHFLKLKNPLSGEQEYLRSTLLPSLLQTAERNRTYAKEFGLFELSRLYLPNAKGELPEEPTYLGVLLRSQHDGYRAAKAALDRLAQELNLEPELRPNFKLKAITHPTQAAAIRLNDRSVGFVARLHPSVVEAHKLGGEVGYLEVDWQALVAAMRPRTHRQISRFPAVRRDLAILVDRHITWQQVQQELKDYQVEFVSDYYGQDLPADTKSLAIRLTLQESDRTLTDAEADHAASAAMAILKQRLQARPRG
jgi:phenylalanyl-tRNA synthetase beta chain